MHTLEAASFMSTDCPGSEYQNNRVVVESFSPRHLAGVVRLHKLCFPGYLLTALGGIFLRRYYSHAWRHGFGSVACDHTGVVSFAIGTSDPEFMRSFYRRNLWLAPLVLLAAFKPVVCKAIVGRLFATRETIPPQPRTRLLGMATAPERRGSSVSSDVLARFEQLANARQVGCSTKPWNRRAITFFVRHGWTISYKNSRGVWFEKALG